jgi:hypothetical protein
MTKLLKEKMVQNDALPRSTILGLFPGRGEGGLQNAERKPVYHRRPPILSRFSEAHPVFAESSTTSAGFKSHPPTPPFFGSESFPFIGLMIADFQLVR